MDLLRRTSLKNKIFFSTLAVVLLLSIVIALLARWSRVSSLTDGLKQQGLGIAYGVAENCRSHILTENIPELTSLMFDARQGEKNLLIAYVFEDKYRSLFNSGPNPVFVPDKLFKAEKPPIVITDIKMPGMDGLTVLKEIKAEHPATAVIMITGHGDSELARKALDLHALAFVYKPIHKEALDAALEKAAAWIATR